MHILGCRDPLKAGDGMEEYQVRVTEALFGEHAYDYIPGQELTNLIRIGP
jgi:hypothetical protein